MTNKNKNNKIIQQNHFKKVLNKFPVDDILIDEPEIKDIIRMIFSAGKV